MTFSEKLNFTTDILLGMLFCSLYSLNWELVSGNHLLRGIKVQHTTCSTLINFLSFAQLSLIRKKMSAPTLSLPFSKIECAPDHHSLNKKCTLFSIIFFQIFILWVLNVGIEVCHLRHKIVVQFFLRIPSPALLCIRVFEQFKTKVN